MKGNFSVKSFFIEWEIWQRMVGSVNEGEMIYVHARGMLRISACGNTAYSLQIRLKL